MIFEIPSLCIPYSPVCFGKNDIKETFEQLFGSCVRRVDEKTKTNPGGSEYKLFFVHFNPFEQDENIKYFFEMMKRDNEVRVEYSEKWYLKINLSNKCKINHQQLNDPDYYIWLNDENPDYYDYKYSLIEEATCKEIVSFLDIFKIDM